MWSNEQLEHWRLLQDHYTADISARTSYQNRNQLRQQIRLEMLLLLNSFLDSVITLKEFNTIFQQKTHKEWSTFGLRGMSGGLFFNKLVKYVPDEETFARLLRMILSVPDGRQNGQQHMHVFLRFLEGLIASRQATRAQLQPARVPFFLSVWWHIQVPEQWPIFYLEGRSAFLMEDAIGTSLQKPCEAYFEFRERFLSLAHALDLKVGELEYLITWSRQSSQDKQCAPETQKGTDASTCSPTTVSPHQDVHTIDGQRTQEVSMQEEIVQGATSTSRKKEKTTSWHTQLQWILARIGLKVGCQVWIAREDHEKRWNNERLGDLSPASLLYAADPLVQQILGHIDILWIYKKQLLAAYEIEQAVTHVPDGLLRLCDLSTLFPKLNAQLCVVAPRHTCASVQEALARPTFQRQEKLKSVAFLCAETLLREQEHILRWANSPAVVQDLISHVSEKG